MSLAGKSIIAWRNYRIRQKRSREKKNIEINALELILETAFRKE